MSSGGATQETLPNRPFECTLLREEARGWVSVVSGVVVRHRRRMSAAAAPTAHDESTPSIEVLDAVQRRVLWLATSIVHHANKVRETPSGVKVGGHQASSASMVSVMTALWFAFLRGPDRVSVKPHASPVLHAINYLLGQLDPKYLTELRALGGLQSY